MFQEQQSSSAKKNSGRKAKCNDRDCQILGRIAYKKHGATAKVTAELIVQLKDPDSMETIRRELHKATYTNTVTATTTIIISTAIISISTTNASAAIIIIVFIINIIIIIIVTIVIEWNFYFSLTISPVMSVSLCTLFQLHVRIISTRWRFPRILRTWG